MNKINVKICAFCHAASYTVEDAFAVAAHHQKYTELGWIAACDYVFVGSEYHKNAIMDRRVHPYASKQDVKEFKKKIVVTGNPFFRENYDVYSTSKKKQVILPNRFDYEKRPNISLDLAFVMKQKHPDWTFVVTTSHPKFKSNKKWLEAYARGMEAAGIIEIKEGLTKPDYHKIMAESKVMMSNSIEENWGICISEALIYNTYPLLMNGLSHPEHVNGDKLHLYDDLDQVEEKLEWLMDARHSVTHYADHLFTDPVNKILSHLN